MTIDAQAVEFCHLVGKPDEAADALAQAGDELHTPLADLETQLAKGNPRRSALGMLTHAARIAANVPARC